MGEIMRKRGEMGSSPFGSEYFLRDKIIKLSARFQDKPCSLHYIEVLGVLLFLIAINDLPQNVGFPITQRLFADNYSLSLHTPNPARAHTILKSHRENFNVIV